MISEETNTNKHQLELIALSIVFVITHHLTISLRAKHNGVMMNTQLCLDLVY